MEADSLFGFEHRHPRMAGQCGGGGKAGDPAANNEDFARRLARQEAVSLSFTILPSRVRRIAWTISSSAGSTGAPASGSQNADRKL